jgi:hypothetical protein
MEQSVLARHHYELRHSMTFDGAAPIKKKLCEIVLEYFEPGSSIEIDQTHFSTLRRAAGRT